MQNNISKMPTQHAELVSKLNDQLVFFAKSLIEKITVDYSLEDTPSNQAYYFDEKTEKYIPIAYETSFVLVDL
ncbi:UNVERIFIED_CONTAM: hypothetical protein O8I53_11290 [Campylobacter lari]